MTDNLRLRKRGLRSVCFEVDSSKGDQIATSSYFETIWQLEVWVAFLSLAAQLPNFVAVKTYTDTTSLGPPNRRRRVRFVGLLDTDGIREVLAAALIAVVVDERPAGQRQAALSGRLPDLEH